MTDNDQRLRTFPRWQWRDSKEEWLRRSDGSIAWVGETSGSSSPAQYARSIAPEGMRTIRIQRVTPPAKIWVSWCTACGNTIVAGTAKHKTSCPTCPVSTDGRIRYARYARKQTA